MYVALYVVTSTALFAGTLVDLCSRSYDFMTLVQELSYDVRLLALLNFIMCFYFVWMVVSIRVVFGEIRVIEMEHIADRIPFSMLTLLFLLLDDENLILDWIWFGLTLCMKVYHTILYDRIDYLQVKIVNCLSDHVLSSGSGTSKSGIVTMYLGEVSILLLLLLTVLDVIMAKLLAYDVFQGLSAIESLLFGIQFGVMGIESFTYLGKLALNVYEMAFYRFALRPTRLVPEPSVNAAVSEEQNLAEDNFVLNETSVNESEGSNGEHNEHNSNHSDPLQERRSVLDQLVDEDGDDDDEDDDDDDDEQIWERKTFYVQTFTIFLSTLKATFYMAFFYMLSFHLNLALPGTIIQGCITSIYQLCKQIRQFQLFLVHSRRLENHLANASESELAAADHICIICRENMHCPVTYERTRGKTLNPRKVPKRLPCSHILHMSCLKDWLERSDSCPLCRKNVFTQLPIPAVNTPPAPAPAAQAQGPTATATVMEPGSSTTPTPTNAAPVPINGFNGEIPIEEGSTSSPRSTATANSFLNLDSSQSSVGTVPNLHSSDIYTSRSLPSLVPRDWVCLPLEPTSDAGQYKVQLSNNCFGSVLVNRRPHTQAM